MPPLWPVALILIGVWIILVSVTVSLPVWLVIVGVVVAVAVIACALVDFYTRGNRVP